MLFAADSEQNLAGTAARNHTVTFFLPGSYYS